jgi:two-component system LytT family response regulator/two-component system response regulator LytT
MRATLRAIVADDEQPARDELAYLLGRLDGIELVGQAGNGIDALEAASRLQPDLIFLDVQMPGLTGFEVARRLLESGPAVQIVFVTAFDEYAIEAFEVNAVDYLLKPVDPSRLETAIDRARRRAPIDALPEREAKASDGSSLSREQVERLVQLVASRHHRREQLALKVGERFLLVHADEVVHASMADETITVVTDRHSGTSNYRTLDELQAQLDPLVFWRVHRAHLVNINKIKEIVPWFSRNYILKMKDEKATEIPVSRTQTRRLRDYLKL